MKKMLIGLVLIISLFVVVSRPVLVLVMEDVQGRKIVLQKKVADGYQFATLICHSVQLTPVYEYYRVQRDGTLMVTATVVQDLGWGMPSNLEYPVEFADNLLIMEHIDRPLNTLHFRISYIAKPHLVLNEEEIDLTRFISDSHVLKIQVDKIPFLIWKFRGEKINVFQEKS